MRTPADRVRHLLLFEVSALAILVPIGTIFFGFDPPHTGSLGITTATIAAVWNYLYNWGFDHALKRLTGSVHKRMRVRVLHAVLFELGLVVMYSGALGGRLCVPMIFPVCRSQVNRPRVLQLSPFFWSAIRHQVLPSKEGAPPRMRAGVGAGQIFLISAPKSAATSTVSVPAGDRSMVSLKSFMPSPSPFM